MKKYFFLVMLFAWAVFLSSCEKDQTLDPDVEKEIETPSQMKRTCGLEAHMDKLLSDPRYRVKHEKTLKAVNSFVGLRQLSAEQKTLPVAVHFQGISNPDIECLRLLAQSQVDVLNEDYGGTNADIEKWKNTDANSFPGVKNGAGTFKFCIATKQHPAGYGLADGDPAVTVNATSGDFDAKWSGYINIFVQPNTGVLGYSPLGGIGNGDGVVIDAAAFGKGQGCGSIQPQAPYNLGRTLTHEMGHYLLLDHIWGGGCGQDDEVSDTPDAGQEYYDCPQLGVQSCGSTDMFMNYMDYVNDACMYMFSEGQVTRSTNYISMSLTNLVDNAANVCTTQTDVPTCSDGIMNGQETGIDCGGPDCKPCEVASCEIPSGFEVTEITSESAKVSWTAVSNASSYTFRFKEESANNYLTTIVTEPNIVLTALASNKIYVYQVSATCQDGPSDFSDTLQFKTTDHGCTEEDACPHTTVGLHFILDDYGSDIDWELIDEEGETVYSGGNYPDGEAGLELRDTFCLQDGCYTLIVTDAYEDGLCCDYGEGSFELVNAEGEIIAESDGLYGATEIIDFCIGDFEGKANVRFVKQQTSVRDQDVIEQSRKKKLNK